MTLEGRCWEFEIEDEWVMRFESKESGGESVAVHVYSSGITVFSVRHCRMERPTHIQYNSYQLIVLAWYVNKSKSSLDSGVVIDNFSMRNDQHQFPFAVFG